MSSKDKNLSSYSNLAADAAKGFCFGIVTSRWNTEITGALKEGAVSTLLKHGAEEKNIHQLEVPGSFELPMGAKILMGKQKMDAVICIGCVIKGETSHNEYINQAVANGITQLSLLSGVPVIFGVLTPNSLEQARDRAGGKHGNKGVEAAVTAIEMAMLPKKGPSTQKIGFS